EGVVVPADEHGHDPEFVQVKEDRRAAFDDATWREFEQSKHDWRKIIDEYNQAASATRKQNKPGAPPALVPGDGVVRQVSREGLPLDANGMTFARLPEHPGMPAMGQGLPTPGVVVRTRPGADPVTVGAHEALHVGAVRPELDPRWAARLNQLDPYDRDLFRMFVATKHAGAPEARPDFTFQDIPNSHKESAGSHQTQLAGLRDQLDAVNQEIRDTKLSLLRPQSA